jgi:hypothetical protein
VAGIVEPILALLIKIKVFPYPSHHNKIEIQKVSQIFPIKIKTILISKHFYYIRLVNKF